MRFTPFIFAISLATLSFGCAEKEIKGFTEISVTHGCAGELCPAVFPNAYYTLVIKGDGHFDYHSGKAEISGTLSPTSVSELLEAIRDSNYMSLKKNPEKSYGIVVSESNTVSTSVTIGARKVSFDHNYSHPMLWPEKLSIFEKQIEKTITPYIVPQQPSK